MQYPDWLDRKEYPFDSGYVDVGSGRMHYVDAGPRDASQTILFLHGNPTWSFEYRNVVRQLDDRHRCIAPDWLGFGLSDAPADWTYRPQDHARCLRLFIERLHLSRFSLVVHDWGGPIGFSVALDNPDSIRSIVVLNSWLWPPAGSLRFRAFASIAASPPARYFNRRFNVLTIAMPLGLGRPWRLSRTAYSHYLQAQQGRRRGCAQLPTEFVKSKAWLENLWARRNLLGEIPKAMVWGRRDRALGTKPIERWLDAFPMLDLTMLDDVGHFVPEEVPDAVARTILRTLPA